jgi:hypothetical protein
MPNQYMVQDHGRDLLGCSMASHTMPWLGNMFFSNAHNSSFTPKFASSFCLSYFVAQKGSVAPIISTTKHVIWIDGLASSPIIRARRARVVMPQYFRPLNMEEKRTLF